MSLASNYQIRVSIRRRGGEWEWRVGIFHENELKISAGGSNKSKQIAQQRACSIAANCIHKPEAMIRHLREQGID